MMSAAPNPMREAPPLPPWPLKRWIAPMAMIVAVAAAYLGGLHHYLSLENFVARQQAIEAFVANHLLVSVVLYMALYIAVVALSLPGAALMSIAGGFLFGWALNAPITVVAATIGAVIVFEVVKTSFGEALAQRAGATARRLSEGFARDAFSYLLFLRLVPAFPFFAVNAVAGLCNVRLRTFVLATVIGIIPGSLVFSYLGTGLGGIIAAQEAANAACITEKGVENCPLNLDLSLLVTTEILLAFAGLGLLALIPVIAGWVMKPKR